jgi:hypothetical protein
MEIAADSFNIYQTEEDVYTKQAPLRQLSTVMKLAREDELLYKKALEIYTEQVTPSQLASAISANVQAMQSKYTKDDRRLFGFVNMQFHYTSQMLLEPLSPVERCLTTSPTGERVRNRREPPRLRLPHRSFVYACWCIL